MKATDLDAGPETNDPARELSAGLVSIARGYGWLKGGLVDRDIEARLAILALVSRQHMFLLGPPGTGKSYLANLVGKMLGPDTSFFELLLTRFTDPSEVFGPISVKRLVQNEEHVRQIEGYLPTADCAFLDEIWKSSSAILNALLTIVNERVFDNGGKRVPVPLKTIFTASNELPQDESLAALYDRLLIRREVKPVSDATKLLDMPDIPRPPRIKHLGLVQEACGRVKLGSDLKKAMKDIKDRLKSAEQIEVGDRRFQQSASLVRASALVGGRAEAEPRDLIVLGHSWWATPDQVLTVARVVEEEVRKAERGRSPSPGAAARAGAPGTPPQPPDRPPPSAPQPPPAGHPMRRQQPGRANPPAGTAPWQLVMATIRSKSIQQMVGDRTFHDQIHECIVSGEAQSTHSGEALELCAIKQDIVNISGWKGPEW